MIDMIEKIARSATSLEHHQPDNAAPHPVARHHPARGRGGEQLAAERAGVGHHAPAGAGPVVGGPGPGVSALLVPLSMPPAAASRPSGIRGAGLAGTTS